MTSQGSRTTEGRGRLYESVVDTIGDTPCIRLNRIAPKHVRLYVKAEFFNPAASVKDRLAISIIEEAERRGELKPGQTVVEATSGNTGIGLAMVCAAKGYPLVVTMADSFSVERRRLMRFLGARVVLTPRAAKGFGMYQKARELAEANGWFLARQFETADNARIHENTTARELLADFDGERLDYWVSGYGTGGTVTGVARVLRRERPETRIILSEPEIAQLLGSGAAQARADDHAPAASHPAFTPHPIQGWTPDFIPYVLQESIDRHFYDEVVPVSGPRRHPGGRARSGRIRHLLHAAGHRRALSVDAAVRRRRERDDAGGGCAVAVDPGLPDAGRLRSKGRIVRPLSCRTALSAPRPRPRTARPRSWAGAS
ncbi:MAG: pyridoxal-phosphate dependent enzyme [Burkholderiales bacterium]|nr:pyridoxal-phosphate dependent enzyme [Burkholderiales bacterium]